MVFTWWPFHPIGLPIAVLDWTHTLWMSVFLAWLIKRLFLKYGGPRLYLRFRPFFLGLILGQYGTWVFWVVIAGLMGLKRMHLTPLGI